MKKVVMNDVLNKIRGQTFMIIWNDGGSVELQFNLQRNYIINFNLPKFVFKKKSNLKNRTKHILNELLRHDD